MVKKFEGSSQQGLKHGATRKTAKLASPRSAMSPAAPATILPGELVAKVRKSLGVTQTIFARMVGVSSRSVAGWESGQALNEVSLRRVRELERLWDALRQVMKPDFIPQWLVRSSEGLDGLSPIEVLERGENDRPWRAVFFLGSGLPI